MRDSMKPGRVDGSPVHAFKAGVHERAAAVPAATERAAAVPAATERAPDASRRNFLKAAPLGALAVVAGTPPAAAAAPLPAPAAPVQSGYHETEHIRRYYQTAAYW